jgi:hypothetical protein
MVWHTSPVAPDELPSLAGFLGSVFGPAAFADLEVLRWKYFAPRADCSGPRSWAIRDGGRIVAHAGIWPLRFRLPGGGAVEGAHVIDWASSADAPGAGAAIYRDALARSSTLIAIGSSGMGRKTLRKIGILPVGEVGVWARAVRPWMQFRGRSGAPLWKNAAKLARNFWWSAFRPPTTAWRAQAAAEFPPSLAAVLRPPPRDAVTVEREVESLNYMLRCPAADRCSGLMLFDGGSLRGYAVLARVGPQTRIAELHVAGGDFRAWTGAYAAATSAAAADPDTAEISAFASADLAARALAATGFRRILGRTLWLGDPLGRLRGAPPLDVQQLASDAFFLRGSDPFLT